MGYLLNINEVWIFPWLQPLGLSQNLGLAVIALHLARTQTKPDILMSFPSSGQLAHLRKTFTGQG